MSDRLALSCALSVMLMALYVLFGADVADVDLAQLRASTQHGASSLPVEASLADLLR